MKKLLCVLAVTSMVACSQNKNESPQEVTTPPEKVTEEDRTLETTKNLTENDFCLVKDGEVNRTMNFDYETMPDNEGNWSQWLVVSEFDGPEKIKGSWHVKDKTVLVREKGNIENTVTYDVVFTEELGMITGVSLLPQGEKWKDFVQFYEVCGIQEKLREARELQSTNGVHELREGPH